TRSISTTTAMAEPVVSSPTSSSVPTGNGSFLTRSRSSRSMSRASGATLSQGKCAWAKADRRTVSGVLTAGSLVALTARSTEGPAFAIDKRYWRAAINVTQARHMLELDSDGIPKFDQPEKYRQYAK